jgi:ribonucleoside-triphosphate reductase
MQQVVDSQEVKSVGIFDNIKKRDGSVVSFDAAKITDAIYRAGEVSGELTHAEATRLTIKVLSLAQLVLRDTPAVEGIQNMVEDVLLGSPYRATAKAYILYRDQHARIREMVKKADIDLIDSYLSQLDWRVKENSNMGYSLQGLNNYIASEVSKTYWLNKIYTSNIREAHDCGAMHIHDLGQLSVYCVGWDLQDLLLSGFTGAPGKSASKPAKHFRSALGQVVNFFYTLQGEAAGAQAFSSFDTYLAPFVKYDGLAYEEVKQAMQEFIFNVNVPTRVGFQTPYTNVTMDLQPPASLKDQRVIIGGEFQKETYGEFQEEMNYVNQAFLEVLTEGDASGRVFTFPIPTYNITEDFDWDNEKLDKLWEVTAKYGIPYFANFINSDMSPDDARSMCCRLRLDVRELRKKGGGLFGANPLTGSVGVVTMNLPRIGCLANDEAEFMDRLGRLMHLAKTSLETKRKVLEGYTEQNLYPYVKFYLRNIKKRFGAYWTNHFSTIGLNGLNEACENLMGTDIGTEEGKDFAVRVMNFMRETLVEIQLETGNNYNLEATPAESTSYRLAKLDKENYKDIITANHEEVMAGKSVPFYTNSSQLPVNYTDDIFELLDLQDPIQSLYTGGTVQHVFLGQSVIDIQAVKNFVRTVCNNYTLSYFTLSPTFSVCAEHGYLRGEQKNCPTCEAKTEVYSRVVGYLRPVDQWNEGKQSEFKIRKCFDDKVVGSSMVAQ